MLSDMGRWTTIDEAVRQRQQSMVGCIEEGKKKNGKYLLQSNVGNSVLPSLAVRILSDNYWPRVPTTSDADKMLLPACIEKCLQEYSAGYSKHKEKRHLITYKDVSRMGTNTF